MISAAATPANKTEHEGRLTRRSWRQPDTFRPRVATSGALARDLRGTETVIVVSDGPGLRSVLVGTLRHLGYRVCEAGDVFAAQRLAHTQRKVHLLLLDVDAPETAEMELVLWFRSVYPETRVLIAANSLWELNLQLGTSEEI